jgi:TPR repeat protein
MADVDTARTHELALSALLPGCTLCRYGDVQAKYLLGTWLCEGRGGARNFERGVALQVEAAAAGHPRANYNIGVYYLEGEGVDTDLAAAAVWFQKASALGEQTARVVMMIL